ncbi:M48 family metallopeptidase [Catenovulum maritimum]|uniref:Peptidase n=1 Tax=Catenovulum maritimum TaxID=1513271 RepID=A0A0J8GWS6_9ALTE|nr:M48 family metallopeptidase [Catenovulum maritimum]KMT65133.1 peptidase [Catenovulum maritimum]
MKKLLMSLGLLALVSCTSTSPTGRTQVLLVNKDQMTQMGIKSFDAMKQETKISTDKKLNNYVQCVSNQIIKTIPKDWQSGWEIVVFDSDMVNAFALPGKKIGVYTGILNVAQSADQLAAIIGHEVGHVIANHSNERASQNKIAGVATQAAQIATQGTEYEAYATKGLGLAAQYGFLLPFSRAHESEADVIGLKYLIKAGFKPEESQQLWRNMAKVGGKAPSEFTSTHPSADTRIDNLGAHIQKFKEQGIKALQPRPSCSR